MEKRKSHSPFKWFISKEEELLQRIIPPFKVEFSAKDLLQVIVGATILAVPVGFTEETWELGGSLPTLNILGIFLLSILFISAFVYYHYYRGRAITHSAHFIKRVFSTYLVSFLVVGIILTLIQRTPWTADWVLAIKRVVIVTLPSSMSATVADTIK